MTVSSPQKLLKLVTDDVLFRYFSKRFKMIYRILILFSLLITIQISFGQQFKPLSKQRIIQLYDSLYLSSEIDSINWNGSIKGCKSGTLSTEVLTKAQMRINFFRMVNRLDPVFNDKKLNTDAQNAALLIKANDHLTHNPSSSMKCYSQSAFDGCHKSNLGFSDWTFFPSTSFVTGFIQDYGESNFYVGHRRWLLYTKLERFGYGATNTSEAILVVDGVSDNLISNLEFTAYPWPGFVPIELIFPKWSFSIPENNTVDFTKAIVSMKDTKGNPITIKKLKVQKDFLDPTLVWTATGLFTAENIEYSENQLAENGYLNNRIKVEIKGVVVNGKTKNYSYFVEPFAINK